MADRFTSGNIARRMYVPEERPGYEEYIADPKNQQAAEESLLNLLTILSGPIGAVPRAVSVARQALGGSRLLNREQQYLPRPDRGNAVLADEMPLLSYSPSSSGAMMGRPPSDMLPPPRLVGSQSAGESPAYGASFRSNLTNRTNGTSILPTAMAVLSDQNRPGLASEPSSVSPETPFPNLPLPEEISGLSPELRDYVDVPMPRARSANLDQAPARPAPERAAQVQEAAANPANMSLRKLWEVANESGESRDFFRADQAMQAAIKRGEDIGYYVKPETMKAGGSVNGKDAAVHKALEIIHHMITSR